jgi:hypothetical protein
MFVALGIQHAMRMHHVVICDLSGCTIVFDIISETARYSRKFTEQKSVFWFSLQFLPETLLTLIKTERDMIKICIGLQEMYPLFSSDFNETWFFSTYFRKIFKYKISWESVHWEMSCFMRMDGYKDGQTDMIMPTVAFRNLAKATNKTNKNSLLTKKQKVLPRKW